ncbi:uncharacterized protein LOC113511859 [Galleria mellonella]|uniref:Uncharacterized protein LOC113511859 n=1 Tax=Galleria mellonella TaxID=7137 RepID=A0ABM3MH85_GALME|nr:uncharacterized protein LOC113511859 [Galleria mellonella]
MASGSNTSIMSIRDMIDAAFGDSEVNVVNHKLIQTILYLLARQLRILERRVQIEIVPNMEMESGSSLSVTEVKLYANVPKKKHRSMKMTSSSKGGKVGTTSTTIEPVSKGVLTKYTGVISRTSEEKSGKRRQEEKPFQKPIDKQFTADKPSTKKSSIDKTSSTISTLQSRSDKTSSEKTTKSTAEPPSMDKTFFEKTLSNITSTDNILNDKISSDKFSIYKTSTEKFTTDRSSTEKSSEKDYHKLMEKIEEKREIELRVIHQRANSREEQDRIPTPMASLDTMEMQYEKLLIVEKVPTDEAKAADSHYRTYNRDRTPRLSIVTHEEFAELATTVRELQTRISPIAGADFPDNIKLMQDLRKGASLTDAMAALQLSARLEGAEKAIQKITSLVTDLASRTPGLENILNKCIEPETEGALDKPARSTESLAVSVTSYSHKTEKFPTDIAADDKNKEHDYITVEDLELQYFNFSNALHELYDEFLKKVTGLTTQSNNNADNALKIANRLQGKLEASLDLVNRMNNLEILVSEYSEQINILDTGLSSQMTNYQEQLTQMQHDLETGLETMAESFANAGGDTTAVAELNTQFTNLQIDLDATNLRQKELRDIQTTLSVDLQGLWKQIELLRDTKSDREEVTDALRDKAGLGALNRLVSLQQFDAIRGDFEKRIGAAYDKFNNQEIIWQKAIDELVRELNEKADWIQVASLRDDVNKNLDMLRSRLHAMMEIVGEPQAAAVSRRLHRDTACLSCASPAHMALEEPGVIPALPALILPRPPTVGAEAPTKTKENLKLCYPGLPIPHPKDPRLHICQRYCGGSHTIVPNAISRAPPGMIINPVFRQVGTGVGSDGKTYMTDEGFIKKPCLPCNAPEMMTPKPSIVERGDKRRYSNLTTLYLHLISLNFNIMLIYSSIRYSGFGHDTYRFS